ncbi:hypothetical protein HanIR_Chr15g0729981 [Helianthus annuus]|nr:hypothetical protein HanIR_Chr15g0729981 [Helianthus annuus]
MVTFGSGHASIRVSGSVQSRACRVVLGVLGQTWLSWSTLVRPIRLDVRFRIRVNTRGRREASSLRFGIPPNHRPILFLYLFRIT